MLSDEEKEAIETIKFFKEMKWYSHAFDNGTEILSEDEKQDIDIVLNLIEKQQKEIEELKDKNKKLKDKAKELIFEKQELTSALLDSTPNDKIKAKIEPVLKQLERKMEEEYNKYGNSREYQDVVDAYNFLQSLLEKEGE